MDIVQYPDEVLTEPVFMVAEGDFDKVPDLVWRMRQAMKEHHGVGIAANQIGERAAVVVVKDKTMVNPQILRYDDMATTMETEGCLSVEGAFLRPAYKAITVEYRNINGKKIVATFKGMDARIVQHEIRHLEGKLINEKKVEKEKKEIENAV